MKSTVKTFKMIITAGFPFKRFWLFFFIFPFVDLIVLYKAEANRLTSPLMFSGRKEAYVVGTRNKVLAVEPLKVSGEASRLAVPPKLYPARVQYRKPKLYSARLHYRQPKLYSSRLQYRQPKLYSARLQYRQPKLYSGRAPTIPPAKTLFRAPTIKPAKTLFRSPTISPANTLFRARLARQKSEILIRKVYSALVFDIFRGPGSEGLRENNCR